MLKADFITSLALLALGIAVVIESWRMPRLAELGVHPYTVPGLVPGLIGVVIAVLGLVLCLRTARAMAKAKSTGPGLSRTPGWSRLALCLALTVGYAAGLVGRLPFWLATLLFVWVFIALFEYQPGNSRPLRVRRLATALLQAAIVAAAVTGVFRYVFLVQLP